MGRTSPLRLRGRGLQRRQNRPGLGPSLRHAPCGVEGKPWEVGGEELPFHLVAIRDLGLTIGEVFEFAALAKDSRDDRRYTSFFVAPAQALVGGCNTAPTPVAIK